MDRHWNVVNEIIYYSISFFLNISIFLSRIIGFMIIFLRAQPILIAAL